MATSGPNGPGTASYDASTAYIWITPDNIKTDDTSYSYANGKSTLWSSNLLASNFGFSVPVGSTIDGIVVKWRQNSQLLNAVKSGIVKLLKAAAIVGDNKANADFWSASGAYVTYGGATDLWGTTLSVAEVNASGFGGAISHHSMNTTAKQGQIEYVTITVYYTEAVGGGGQLVGRTPINTKIGGLLTR